MQSFLRLPFFLFFLFLLAAASKDSNSKHSSSSPSVPLQLSPNSKNLRRYSRPSLVVLSTLDGSVIGIDAASGKEVFAVRSDTPSLSSWARDGHPEYVPTLDGALYKLDPVTGDAINVDPRFISTSQSDHDSKVLAASGQDSAGAVVLTAQSTSALSVNLRTGNVERSLTFSGADDAIEVDGVLSGSIHGDDIVLLSRTKRSVRVVDAASGEILANATLTHTNPSFLEKGRCLQPGASSDADASYTASISFDRTKVVVRDAAGQVKWKHDIDSTVVDAHGMGSVFVATEPEEVQAELAAQPNADRNGNRNSALSPTARFKSSDKPSSLYVASKGKTKYLINAHPGLSASNTANIHNNNPVEYKTREKDTSQKNNNQNSAPDNTSETKMDAIPSNISLLFLCVVVICVMAGYALGRRPKNRIRFNNTSRNDTNNAEGRWEQPQPSFDGLPIPESITGGEVTVNVPKKKRKQKKRGRAKVVEKKKNNDAEDRRNELDENTFVASNESTGSRSSGGVISHRTDKGLLEVGSMLVSQNVLGTGSHGTVVYEGVIRPGDRKVAVKRLLRQFFDDARKEISLLVQLDETSPYVVRYHAMEEDSEFIYLALELCAGNLAERVLNKQLPATPDEYKSGPVPIATVRALRQLLQGLAGLHKAGVVHRDLKPQNVLISRTTANGSADVKLADVGLATRLDANRSSYSAVTNVGGGVGTQGWRAPEVLSSKRQTKAVDIFSAGCVVYFVLTGGKHPFGSNTLMRDGRILQNNFEKEPLEALHLPEAVDIVMKMIQPEASERPTAEAALLHPFFWPDTLKLSFLIDISDRLYDLRNEPRRYTENMDRYHMAVKHCSDWIVHLDFELISELGREYESTASGILRVIRNKRNHYSELSPRLQKILGPLPEDDEGIENSDSSNNNNNERKHNFLTYFTSKLPHLLMTTYNYALENPALIEQPHFTRYGITAAMACESPALHPMVRKRREELDQSIGTTDNDADQTDGNRNERRRYSFEVLRRLRKEAPACPEIGKKNMKKFEVYCPNAYRGNLSYAQVVENSNNNTESWSDEDEDEEEYGRPPGFEDDNTRVNNRSSTGNTNNSGARRRFFNSASPSLRPRSPATTIIRPPRGPPASARQFESPRVTNSNRNSNNEFARDEITNNNMAPLEPLQLEPEYRIDSVTKRRERMAREKAAKQNNSNNANGNNNNNNNSNNTESDFGSRLARGRNTRW